MDIRNEENLRSATSNSQMVHSHNLFNYQRWDCQALSVSRVCVKILHQAASGRTRRSAPGATQNYGAYPRSQPRPVGSHLSVSYNMGEADLFEILYCQHLKNRL
jgi:hypothetical protein